MRLPFQFRDPVPRRLVAATAAVVLGGLMVPGIASARASSLPQQPVGWRPCDWYSSHLGGPVPECATVTVPRDWANPGSGPTLNIAISRTKATDTAHRKGILFTNPGGPGGSGINLSWLIALVQPKVAAQYDIIGMDPRGVGESTQLTCDVPLDPLLGLGSFDNRDLSTDAVASRQTVEKLIADSCAQNPLTRYINTWQTTHDMDLIRGQLGEAKLNYLGYSYGTWLGAKYAALFPASTGKVVLDSNTSWMDDLAGSWELMPMSFQRRWERQFAPWATRSSTFSKYLGTAPAGVDAVYEQDRAAYNKYVGDPFAGNLLDRILWSSLYTDPGFFGAAFDLGLLKVCLVDNSDWSQAAISSCVGDFINRVFNDLGAQVTQEVTQQFQPQAQASVAQLFGNATVPNLHPDSVTSVVAAAGHATGDTIPVNGVFYAVRCGDGGQWHNPSWWVNYTRQFGSQYPLAGYGIPQEVCSYWTLPTQTLPNPDAHRLGPIVTVEAEFDPPTAYENTVRNVEQFAGARLISVDDAGAHGQYGVRGNGCVDDAVNGYLLDDVVPPARGVCGATPLLFEDTVYPQPGPVDAKMPPRAVHAVLVNPEIQKQLDKLIN